MKFGQLTDYNSRNIFPEKSYAKCGEETISRPFSVMFYYLTNSIAWLILLREILGNMCIIMIC